MFSKREQQSKPEMVKLKNGSEVQAKAVPVIMETITKLNENNRILFFELVMKCKYPEFALEKLLFEDSVEELEKLSIMNDEEIHKTTRNIILSAVQGDLLDLVISSPIESDLSKKLTM